jgi:hypothetical protein
MLSGETAAPDTLIASGWLASCNESFDFDTHIGQIACRAAVRWQHAKTNCGSLSISAGSIRRGTRGSFRAGSASPAIIINHAVLATLTLAFTSTSTEGNRS